MELYEFLKSKRLEKGIKPEEVINKLNISRQTLHYWESPPNKDGTRPKGENLLKLIGLYGLDPIELKEKFNINIGELIIQAFISFSKNSFSHPILEISEIKNWLANPILTSDYKKLSVMIVKENISKKAFVLTAKSTSMVPPPGYLDEAAIYPGFMILIDPEIKPIVGKNVLICIRDKEYVIRQLCEDVTGKRFLRAVNPHAAYTNIPLNDNIEIIGVLVSASKEY